MNGFKRVVVTEPDGLPIPRRYWAVGAVLAGTFLGNLDGAIANVALPTIASSLSSSPASTVWVVTSYQIMTAVCLLPVSALGEVIGFRRVYLLGMLVFLIGSLACALAPSLSWLVGARVIQGLGSAAVSSIGIAMTRQIFPRDRVGRAVALFGLTVAVSSAIGPSVAAGIMSVATWHWLFAINLPPLILAIALGWRALPDDQPRPRPIDWSGTVLNGLFFALFIIGLDSIGGGTSLGVAGAVAIVGGLAFAFLLFRQQRRQTVPMVPIDLMRIPLFSLSLVTASCSYAAQGMAYVALPFLLQNVIGRSEVETGLLITPWPLIIVFVAPLAGRLSDRYPAGILCSIGLTFLAAGLFLLAAMPTFPSDLDIAWRAAMCGVGFGLYQTPNNRVLMLSGPVHRSGAAAGAMASARLLGSATGAALVAVIFQIAGTGGGRAALVGAGLFALLGIVISSARLLDRDATAAGV